MKKIISISLYLEILIIYIYIYIYIINKLTKKATHYAIVVCSVDNG
jgi:hypothetical protein